MKSNEQFNYRICLIRQILSRVLFINPNLTDEKHWELFVALYEMTNVEDMEVLDSEMEYEVIRTKEKREEVLV